MALIRIPFADSGDKAAVPVAAQSDGSVSYVQGYPTAYSLNPETDAAAKRIERTKMNQLFNDITTAIREMQINGVKPYITSDENGGSAFSYGLGALVIYNGVVYRSLVANNTQLPTVTANWSALVAANDNPGRLLNVQVFTNSGIYTPTAGAKKIIVEVQGAGGAGGGTPATSSSQNSVASGGSSGQYIKSLLQVANLAATVTVTVGTAGAGTSAGQGGRGGSSIFGSYITAVGGFGGGAGTAANSAYVIQPGSIPGLPSAGNIINAGGSPGGAGIFTQLGAGVSGNGGSSRFGGGGNPGSVSGGGYTQAVGYGSGGAGVAVSSNTAAQTGPAGAGGIVIVWEYA